MMKQHAFIIIAILLLGGIAGCTLNVSTGSENIITEEDLLAARQIIGDVLSTDNSGAVLSINDAMSILAQNTSSSSAPGNSVRKDRSGIGNELNLKHSYEDDTGKHIVTFQRVVEDPLFTKRVGNTLTYIYQDTQQQPIAYPTERIDEIRAINYTAIREGQIQTLQKTSSFIHNDSLFISGLTDSNPTNIAGTQTTEGTLKTTSTDGNPISRYYKLQLDLLNITTSQTVRYKNRSISFSMKGNISFLLQLWPTAEKQGTSTTIRGIIEYNGDGTALLRSPNFPEKYLVNLKDGTVTNIKKEFKGSIAAINTKQHTLTLASGITIYTDDNTVLANTDYQSLEPLQELLNNGESIFTNGTGQVIDNIFIADSIYIEIGKSDPLGSDETITFNNIVTSAYPGERTFILQQQVRARLMDSAKILDNGDYRSLQEVAEALKDSITVTATGKAVEGADGSSISVSEVTFTGSNKAN